MFSRVGHCAILIVISLHSHQPQYCFGSKIIQLHGTEFSRQIWWLLNYWRDFTFYDTQSLISAPQEPDPAPLCFSSVLSTLSLPFNFPFNDIFPFPRRSSVLVLAFIFANILYMYLILLHVVLWPDLFDRPL